MTTKSKIKPTPKISKHDAVLKMLRSNRGTSIAELQKVTGWQPHIRTERRETLLRAVAAGRAWFKELSAGVVADIDAIAIREDRSKRSVQMLISLAFVAPDIIEAAVAGALPRGIGLTRLTDLPPLWTEQRRVLGLRA